MKDRVDKGELTVEYYNTLLMLANYFTKPLEEEPFRRLRRVIIGWDPIDILTTFITPADKERVGNNVSKGVGNNVYEGSMNNRWLTYRDVLLDGQQMTRRECNIATNKERINKDIE